MCATLNIFLSNFGKFLTCPVILTIKLSNNDSGLQEVLTSKRQPKPVILFFEFCTDIFLVKLLTLIYLQYYFRNAFFVVLYFYTLCVVSMTTKEPNRMYIIYDILVHLILRFQSLDPKIMMF